MITIPPPFNIPKFSYRTGALDGGPPFKTMFYPMVKSGLAEFHWDFEGDREFVKVSNGAVSYTFIEEGVYKPLAKAVFEDGTEETYSGPEIDVHELKVVPLKLGIPPAGDNNRWETAKRLHENSRVIQTCNYIDVFKFPCNRHAIFELRLLPVTMEPPEPLELEVLTESGKFIASTKGKWLRLKMDDHVTYQIQVKGQGYYSLMLEEYK